MSQIEHLRGDPNFRRYWAAKTLEELGSRVAFLVIPLIAALYLGASALEMGMLAAAQYAPYLLFGLYAGVWVDRVRRRPLMVSTNLLRLGAFGVLASGLSYLNLGVLYALSILVGSCALLHAVAVVAYLPTLVGPRLLALANSRLHIGFAFASVVGLSLGGFVIEWLPLREAIFIPGAIFGVAAMASAAIGMAEVKPALRGSAPGLIAEGLRATLRDPVLRPLTIGMALFNFFLSMSQAVTPLYLIELGAGPLAIGLVYGAQGVGGVLGAILASRLQRLPLGITGVIGLLGVAGGRFLFPIAVDMGEGGVALCGVGLAVCGISFAFFSVLSVSVKQYGIPPKLLGRVNATMRYLAWGVMPIGAMVGGAVGHAIGLWESMFVVAGGYVLVAGWLLTSPLMSVRTVQEEAPQEGTEEVPQKTRGTALIRTPTILDESFKIPHGVAQEHGTVVVDLDATVRISSYGVKVWIQVFNELPAAAVYFVRCRPVMFEQFNRVTEFGGRGTLLSFYAMYACDGCEQDIEILVDLEQQHEHAAAGALPPHPCAACGGEMKCYTLTENLRAIGGMPRPQPPPSVAQVLSPQVAGRTG